MPMSIQLSFLCVDSVSNRHNNPLALIYAGGFYLCSSDL
jgi:hypothetical protein